MRSITGGPSRDVCIWLTASMLLASLPFPASAQSPLAFISGGGLVRQCDPDGGNIDSAGNQYAADGDEFVARLMEETYSCLQQPQTFYSYQSADPTGTNLLGWRMVSQNRLTVTAEPQYTEAQGLSNMFGRSCLEASGQQTAPAVALLIYARGRRSQPDPCLDERGTPRAFGACSSVVGRFGGLGDGRFMNLNGTWNNPDEFYELSDPGNEFWGQRVVMTRVPGTTNYILQGGVSGTLMTRVAGAPSVSAFGDMRFWFQVDKQTTRLVTCPGLDRNTRAAAGDPLPFPSWMIDVGEAIPDQFTLAISPPTSVITLSQSFDLTLMAATGGTPITGIAGTIDGQDVSGALAACLAPAGAMRGVTGPILSCRGLSGRMLAGFFGTGAHTLAVTLALSDGRTISDSVTWTILP